MTPSGAEVLRQIKSRIAEVDPSEVREQLQNGTLVLDVREAEDFRATSLETLRHMVVAGLGVTLMPELAVESPFGAQRGLVIRQFTKPAPARTVGAVWRKSTTRSAAIDAVCGILAGAMVEKS